MKSFIVGIFVAAGLMSGGAQAADVKIFAAAAMNGPFKELLPAFEKASGHKVAVEYAASPQTTAKVESGQPFDMVVTTFAEEVLKDPVRNGHFQASPRPLLASIGL